MTEQAAVVGAEIAKKAKILNTGARALRSVAEKIMRDVMYELPDFEPGAKFCLTDKVVRGEEKMKPEYNEKAA
jgi:ATP-dependent Clp protease ATP-binding subunit ClpX